MPLVAQPLRVRRSYSTFIRRLVSPVFFSTAEDGSTQRGLAGVPHDRPMLLVGNHQTFALDLGIFVEQIVRECGFLPRGLAHPAIFSVSAAAPLSHREAGSLSQERIGNMWGEGCC